MKTVLGATRSWWVTSALYITFNQTASWPTPKPVHLAVLNSNHCLDFTMSRN
ncbi:hypothetical protein PR003_g23381 [Phytophthora rubi]|uniref:Uncharacterized protein n=1 Tax=Phytophthora rubi TaxID=129364 RepID=A0A6A3IXE3_9STRA|nr:hypothetical protein PR002_g26913 [Phytophthora rubi]KAE8987799.1 hypothetical protein PR001_g22224 [Phytophthora rubi]KAE9297898.1 hypothetical protein PR003_g23381 [Phytophthora rubi]